MRSSVAGYTVLSLSEEEKKKNSFSCGCSHVRGSALSLHLSSDVCKCVVHVGLDLRRTGNFPRAGADGSLPVDRSRPVTAALLNATAGASGLFSIQLIGGPMVPALPVFLLFSTPLVQATTLNIWPHLLPVHLGVGFVGCHLGLISPGVIVPSSSRPTFVSTVCSPSILPVCCILLLVLPLFPLPIRDAGLLSDRMPGVLRFLHVPQRSSRVLFPVRVVPRAGGVVVSLSMCFPLLVYFFPGSAMALLCSFGALGMLHRIHPTFCGSFGTSRLGVNPTCFPGLTAGAGGVLVVMVRKLLSL